jgi:hypothetical protein
MIPTLRELGNLPYHFVGSMDNIISQSPTGGKQPVMNSGTWLASAGMNAFIPAVYYEKSEIGTIPLPAHSSPSAISNQLVFSYNEMTRLNEFSCIYLHRPDCDTRWQIDRVSVSMQTDSMRPCNPLALHGGLFRTQRVCAG